MTRPAHEIADVIRLYGHQFLANHGQLLAAAHKLVLTALTRCRTAALGGHLERCDNPDCRHQRPAYNSCRNRHCPKCGGQAQARWVQAQLDRLLPVPYFHVVFTLPQALAQLALHNQRLLYGLLFRAAAGALRSVAENPKHLGARIGFFAVLHTWGQTLVHHPHLHCVVPGGGVSAHGQSWVPARRLRKGTRFFLPVRVLSARFRRLFLEGLIELFRDGRLEFHGDLQDWSEPRAFRRRLAELAVRDWVVHAQAPMAGPAQVVEYLGRYTHRVAISNHRLLGISDATVSFTWKDYRQDGRLKTLRLEAGEFLRRFLLHVLPRGFVRIRYFGLLANCRGESGIEQARRLLELTPAERLLPVPSARPDSLLRRLAPLPGDLCPVCGRGHMLRVELLPLVLARSPPAAPNNRN
ncbi:MAG: IS91 family transposase [Acidobacteria bacterium]|nr:MAG: IS91 family transposase [Acidobacteriota bacterium]